MHHSICFALACVAVAGPATVMHCTVGGTIRRALAFLVLSCSSARIVRSLCLLSVRYPLLLLCIASVDGRPAGLHACLHWLVSGKVTRRDETRRAQAARLRASTAAAAAGLVVHAPHGWVGWVME